MRSALMPEHPAQPHSFSDRTHMQFVINNSSQRPPVLAARVATHRPTFLLFNM